MVKRWTYLVLAFAFFVLHCKGSSMALDVSCINDAVICAKLAFGSRIQKCHVFKGPAMNQDSGFTSDWAGFRLDGIDCEADVVSSVLKLHLAFLALLFLREGKHRHVIGVNSCWCDF